MSDYPILEFKNNELDYGFDLVLIEKLFTKTYSNHSPFEYHQIEFFVFILYTDGEEIHTIDFTDYYCKKGTLLAIRKGQIHKFSNKAIKGNILVFDNEFLGSFFNKNEVQKSLLLFNEFINKPKIQLNKKEYANLFDIVLKIQEEYFNHKDSFSGGIIRSLLQVFITKIYRFKIASGKSNINKKYLHEFIQLQNSIESHYKETLKVRDYADFLGLSTKVLNQITKSIVNKTAKDFIDEICINNIKRELVNSNKSVKEISYDSGFEETTNFTNYFKKRVGKTPSEFRNN
jgi:AraC-like DNA-binding protein